MGRNHPLRDGRWGTRGREVWDGEQLGGRPGKGMKTGLSKRIKLLNKEKKKEK